MNAFLKINKLQKWMKAILKVYSKSHLYLFWPENAFKVLFVQTVLCLRFYYKTHSEYFLRLFGNTQLS